MQAQAQKFYSSKSNAARAAKAMFGEDFKNVADLTEQDGQFAYVAKTAAPVSKRQADEAAIRVLQDMIAKAQSMENIQVCERAVGDLFKANEITEGVMQALLDQCSAKVQELASALADKQANEELVADAEKLAGLKLTHSDNCPHCGICLDNGMTDFANMVDTHGTFAKAYEHMKHEYACLGCGGEWGPAINPTRHISAIESPCRAVWELADQAKAANGGAMPQRKDVLAACERMGIAFYTARTQYQLWRTTQKEMEQRAAAQAKKA